MRLDRIKVGGRCPVVFIHGVLSNGEACWTNANGVSWPTLLADVDAGNVLSIYSFTYLSDAFSGNYNLEDAVDELAFELAQAKLLERKKVIFVCHSMGGIVARRFLVRRQLDLVEREISFGLFLVASPSLGSDYANWLLPVIKFAGHRQAEALRFSQSNVWLNALDRDFMALKESKKLVIEGKEIYEHKSLFLKKFWFIPQMVKPESAGRFFADPFKVPNSDHGSIAKPATASDIQHRILCEFIGRVVPFTPRENKVPTTPQRVFVSYRHTEPDYSVATSIRAALEAAGHIVFIDRKLVTGQRWADEIAKEMARANYLVLLLSVESIKSEMVLGEYELARKHNVRILPVRIQFTGPLPSSIGALDEIHYALWRKDAPFEGVAAEIVNVIRSGGDLPNIIPDADAASVAPYLPIAASSAVPVPSADMRAYLAQAPGGALPFDSPFYVEREAERNLAAQLRAGSATVLIKGPRQSGKSSMLGRSLALARQMGRRTFLLDFQSMSQGKSGVLETLETLLLEIGRRIQREFKLTPSMRDRWDERIGAENLTEYLEDELFGVCSDQLVFFFDEIDLIFNKEYRNEFFAMLRHWHNSRATYPATWGRVSMALAHATEASLWISNINQSPFNVATSYLTADFTPDQIAWLNDKRGSPLAWPVQSISFMQLLGGHPYLVQRALYSMHIDRLDFTHFAERAVTDSGPFSDHLRAIGLKLKEFPDAAECVKAVVQLGTCEDELLFERIKAAGWVDGSSGAARIRLGLYQTFFQRYFSRL